MTFVSTTITAARRLSSFAGPSRSDRFSDGLVPDSYPFEKRFGIDQFTTDRRCQPSQDLAIEAAVIATRGGLEFLV